MTKKKPVIAAGILAGLVILATVCFFIFQQSKNNPLVGKWEETDFWGIKTNYEFSADGKIKIDGVENTYIMDWDSMKLTIGNNSMLSVKYSIEIPDENTLLLKSFLETKTLIRKK